MDQPSTPLLDWLHAVGFDGPGINHRLEIEDAIGETDALIIERRLSGDEAFDFVARLFLLGRSLPVVDVERVMPESVHRQAFDLGLLEERDGAYTARFRLMPLGRWMLASDFDPRLRGRDEETDFVLGAGAASQTLANLTPRRPVGRALDVGAGGGVQAMLCSTHAGEVIGTDINTRALEVARLNADLNGLANLDWRHGAFYEPVEGDLFDLIVCNPPFVISPESRYQFRDSGLQGDGVSAMVVQEAAGRLAPGGTAVMLINWYHDTEESWEDRPKAWLEELPVNRWLLKFHTHDAVLYADRWLRAFGVLDTEDGPAQLDAWLRYYREIGAHFMSAGAVVLQRGARENWYRSDDAPQGKHLGVCGEQVARILVNETGLHDLGSDPAALRTLRPRLVDEHRVESVLQLTEGRWQTKSLRLRLEQGMSMGGQMDVVGMTLLGQFDSTRTVDEAMHATLPADQLTPEVEEAMVTAVVKWLRAGVLTVDEWT